MTILRSSLLDHAGFRHGFPTRDAADAQLLRAVGAPRIVQVRQVHGARVVDAPLVSGAEAEEEADALVARADVRARPAGAVPPGGPVAVGVRVADCVPVLMADGISGDVAAIHAGWRGVVGGVIGAAFERLHGTNLFAVIGPCIGACCFEVGADVAKQIGFVVWEREGKAYVDLRAAVRAQLRGLGIPDARIENVPGCTMHEPELFHSFRRDGTQSGRMLAAIAARSLVDARVTGETVACPI